MVKLSLFLNLLSALYVFWFMKKKSGFHHRTAVALTLCVSSVIGFIIATNLQLLMMHVQYSILIVTVVSCFIGVLFGFIHSRSCGTIGYYHGLTAGLMGAMLGIVIHNPSLCHLPVYYAHSVDQHAVLFSLFTCVLSAITVFVVQFVNWKMDKGVNHVE